LTSNTSKRVCALAYLPSPFPDALVARKLDVQVSSPVFAFLAFYR
jgi:hypothetical protein